MAPRDDSAAYAVNWWQVLGADALLGLAPIVVGFVFFTGFVRLVLIAGGLVYLGLVLRRAARWRRLRRDAGL